MDETGQAFLAKAEECLTGADIALANARYNNCANRCYYACFHAARAALVHAGIRPPRGDWGHEFVQAQFSGLLVNRRKIYGAEFRDTLPSTQALRNQADYDELSVSRANASRALRRARDFLNAVRTVTEDHA